MHLEKNSWNIDSIRQTWKDWKKLPHGYETPFCQIYFDHKGDLIPLTTFVTSHFVRGVNKTGVDRSNKLYQAFHNLCYGYHAKQCQSRGGRDGIFAVTENHRPENSMMAKLYSGFLYHQDRRENLNLYFEDLEKIQGVRVVTHGLRLLGFLQEKEEGITLALVDVDVSR